MIVAALQTQIIEKIQISMLKAVVMDYLHNMIKIILELLKTVTKSFFLI